MTSHIQAEYRAVLLDKYEQELYPLDGFTGGSLQLSSDTRLRASGTIDLIDRGQIIDFLSDRVRIDYVRRGQDPAPLGVFLMQAPQRSFTGNGVKRSISLLGKLAHIDQSELVYTYNVRKGENLIAKAYEFLRSNIEGDMFISVTPSDKTARTDMSWESGKSVLTIVNDLLKAAGYFSLWVDQRGQYRIQPYREPQYRPLSLAFEEGEASFHLPDWEHEQDLTSVPNRVTLVAQSNGELPPLVGTAFNNDPNSPFSMQNRRRIIAHTETGLDVADQATIDMMARRKLEELSRPGAQITCKHVPQPFLQPNDRVTWNSQGHFANGVVTSIRYQLDPSALCDTVIQEVTI